MLPGQNRATILNTILSGEDYSATSDLRLRDEPPQEFNTGMFNAEFSKEK
jgi:hypothetical protein